MSLPNYASIEKMQIAANSMANTDYLFISSLVLNSSFGRTKHEIMKTLVFKDYEPRRRETRRVSSSNSLSVSRQHSSTSSTASSP